MRGSGIIKKKKNSTPIHIVIALKYVLVDANFDCQTSKWSAILDLAFSTSAC